MSATYTVVEATHKKDVPGRHGPMQVINLKLTGGPEGDVLAEWFTKAQTALPASGSSLEGDLENDPQYGWKFKKAQQQGGGGPGGNGRPRDPAERESIERQVAAKVASDLLVALMAQGTFKPDGVDALGTAHTKLATTVAGGIKV